MSGRFLLTPEHHTKRRVSGAAVAQRYPWQSVQGAFLALFMGTPKALYSCFTQPAHPLKYRKRREREVILYCCSENVIYSQHAAL